MNEFMTLSKFKKEDDLKNEFKDIKGKTINEIVSFHYSKLVSIQEKLFLLDDSGDVTSSTEIFVSDYPEPIKVKEKNKEIIEMWEQCRENLNERIKAKALGILN